MSEAIAKPRSKSLQRRDAKLALKASKRYKRMQQRESAPKLTGRQRVFNWLLHIIMALMVIYCLVPLLWVIFSSTKTSEGIFSSFGLWFDDKNVFWQNVQDTFAYQHGVYTRWLFNTIMYAVVAGVGARSLPHSPDMPLPPCASLGVTPCWPSLWHSCQFLLR
mgnify:CR=1 FL=1